jgi:hypothetical protein
MSSASVTSVQQHAGNGYVLLVGAPASTTSPQPVQLQQQNNATPKNQSNLGYDTIAPNNQNQFIVDQPLLHHTEYNAARADTIDSSQIHAKYVDAMFTAAVVLLAFLAIPVVREIYNSRAKVKRELFAEQTVQHTMRNLHQSQQDKTTSWIEDHENLTTKAFYIRMIVSNMRENWNKLQTPVPEQWKDAYQKAQLIQTPIELVESTLRPAHADIQAYQSERARLGRLKRFSELTPIEAQRLNQLKNYAEHAEGVVQEKVESIKAFLKQLETGQVTPETRHEDLDRLIETGRLRWEKKGFQKMGALHLGAFESHRPLLKTAHLVHQVVEKLQDEGRCDNDLARYVQAQTDYLDTKHTIGETETDIDHLLQSRHVRYTARLGAFHQSACKDFVSDVFERPDLLDKNAVKAHATVVR